MNHLTPLPFASDLRLGEFGSTARRYHQGWGGNFLALRY